MSKSASKPFAFTRREVMEEIAALSGGRCLLAFSRSKDSIAAWLELRESGLFPEIIPFHLSLVPGMRFIEPVQDEAGLMRPCRCTGGLRLLPGGGQQWLNADMKPVAGPA